MEKSFWSSVTTVLTGTAIAQLIPIIGSLIIARIYSVNEFGIFASWLGVVSIISVVVTGRFEQALAIERDGRSRDIFALVILWIIFIFTLIISIPLFILSFNNWWIFENFSLFQVFLLIPSFVSIAITQTWQSLAAADGKYQKLSAMRIGQSFFIISIQVFMGVYYGTANSLMIGQFLGTALSVILSFVLIKPYRIETNLQHASIKRYWKKHVRLPRYSLPADTINSIAVQAPIFIVTSRFGPEIAGFLAMSIRIMGAPIGLMGKAVLDVFKRHASLSYRKYGTCRPDYLKTFKILVLGSIFFTIIFITSGRDLFVLLLGERWDYSGFIALLLLPMFLLKFIASPLSYIMYIAEKQNVDLIWQISLLLLTFISLNLFAEFEISIIAYSVVYSSLYVVYLGLSYNFSNGNRQK
jgi:O-antigen/teichoic acid export membrane protein